MRKAYYITYNDTYSGIYQGQVIDVINHLNQTFDIEVKLIAFVPLRLYKAQKKIIKSKLDTALVLPILGKTAFVKLTSKWLSLKKTKHYSAITRGPLAFILAKNHFKNVIYDARAAVKAEVLEYQVAGNNQELSNLMIEAEKRAVNEADFYISVTNKLVDYWKSEYQKTVNRSKIALVPCTVNAFKLDDSKLDSPDNIIRLVYAGGTGKWQSFDTIVQLLDELLGKQENTEAIFLTKENAGIDQLIEKYPNKVKRLWVKPEEVNEVLAGCDYGLLIRDDKVTNNVASPVKFAEYLNAGLSVLISPKVGDFSQFVRDNNCGIIIENKIPELTKLSKDQKEHNKTLCEKHFSKISAEINEEYKKLVEFVING